MVPEACASRYLNAQALGTAPVGNQKYGAHDPNCRVCKDGKSRAKKIGTDGVEIYRKQLTQIKMMARVKAMSDVRWGKTFREIERFMRGI